jgi:hypothetical protein
MCCVGLNKLLYHIVQHNGMAAIKTNYEDPHCVIFSSL